MFDPTESIRRTLRVVIDAHPGSREALEAEHGQVWDPNQLGDDFDVIGFAAPIVAVRRKERRPDGQPSFPGHAPLLFCLQRAQVVDCERKRQ